MTEGQPTEVFGLSSSSGWMRLHLRNGVRLRDFLVRFGRRRATVREADPRRAVRREVAVVAQGGRSDGSAGSDGPGSTAVRCHCGALLADRIDGMTVVIDGMEYQFRRRTDKLTCPDCGHQHPRRNLRVGIQPEPPDTGQRRRQDDHE